MLPFYYFSNIDTVAVTTRRYCDDRYFLCSIYSLFFLSVIYSTLLHLPPNRFHCVGGYYIRSNPGQLRVWLRHWQSDARSDPLRTRIDLIHLSVANSLVSIDKMFCPNVWEITVHERLARATSIDNQRDGSGRHWWRLDDDLANICMQSNDWLIIQIRAAFLTLATQSVLYV